MCSFPSIPSAFLRRRKYLLPSRFLRIFVVLTFDILIQTQRYIRLYDLLGQKLLKTLNPSLKWISSMDVHPMGGKLLFLSPSRFHCLTRHPMLRQCHRGVL